MKKTLMLIGMIVCMMLPTGASAKSEGEKINAQAFELLDLDRPGLEAVKAQYAKGNLKKAAELLLRYYRSRTAEANVDIDINNIKVTDRDRKIADDALDHTFYADDGYQPSYNYGKDINWKYWPIKDNELRWMLHRQKWFTPMGKMFRTTGDEMWAKEWKAEFLDWIKKNPLVDVTTAQFEMEDNEGLSADVENARFAWRPLEISHRLQDQINQFTLFITSKNFTPAFLTEFLWNYHRHGDYIYHHYSAQGNHLLFEAQRMFYAGTFFPEFKDSKAWQQSGIDILNREIKKQVLDDGGQYELDPHYHLACIGIFTRALQVAQANHIEKVIPQSYKDTIERMITFYYNICYPDYSNPCFSDAKRGARHAEIRNYQTWTRLFPDNPYIKWFATLGKEGKRPDNLSRGYLTSGFFTFRNGWDKGATVMVVKAGPKGEWHAQPDNGTFELWFNGRNLFPDSGSYIFAGQGEIQKQRDWFRQTRVHNTLTLDNRNLETQRSKTILWQPEGDVQTLVTENPSYSGLRHRRTIFFVDRKYFVIVDEAMGTATGTINLHYLLTDGNSTLDTATNTIATDYDGNSNVYLACTANGKIDAGKDAEGWYSLGYRQKTARPGYSFNVEKRDASTVSFATVIYPAKSVKGVSAKARLISSSETGMKVAVSINGAERELSWTVGQATAQKK